MPKERSATPEPGSTAAATAAAGNGGGPGTVAAAGTTATEPSATGDQTDVQPASQQPQQAANAEQAEAGAAGPLPAGDSPAAVTTAEIVADAAGAGSRPPANAFEAGCPATTSSAVLQLQGAAAVPLAGAGTGVSTSEAQAAPAAAAKAKAALQEPRQSGQPLHADDQAQQLHSDAELAARLEAADQVSLQQSAQYQADAALAAALHEQGGSGQELRGGVQDASRAAQEASDAEMAVRLQFWDAGTSRAPAPESTSGRRTRGRQGTVSLAARSAGGDPDYALSDQEPSDSDEPKGGRARRSGRTRTRGAASTGRNARAGSNGKDPGPSSSQAGEPLSHEAAAERQGRKGRGGGKAGGKRGEVACGCCACSTAYSVLKRLTASPSSTTSFPCCVVTGRIFASVAGSAMLSFEVHRTPLHVCEVIR